MDLFLDGLGLIHDGVLELLRFRRNGLVEVVLHVAVGFVASVEQLGLGDLDALPKLNNVRVDVGVELALCAFDLVLNLVLLEESSGVHVFVQEAVGLLQVRSSELVAVVQVATQVLMCGGQRAEDGAGRLLNWVVHNLRALVREKVHGVENEGGNNEVSEAGKDGHDEEKKWVEATVIFGFGAGLGEGTVGSSVYEISSHAREFVDLGYIKAPLPL